MSDTPQPGWYDDPEDPNHIRYWDGASWTSQIQPRAGAEQAASPPAAGPTTPQPRDGSTKPKKVKGNKGSPPRFKPTGPTLFDLSDLPDEGASGAPGGSPAGAPLPAWPSPNSVPRPKPASSKPPRQRRRDTSGTGAIAAALSAEKPPSRGWAKVAISWIAVAAIIAAGGAGYWWMTRSSTSTEQACEIVAMANAEPNQVLMETSLSLALSDPADSQERARLVQQGADAGQSMSVGIAKGYRAAGDSRDASVRAAGNEVAAQYELVATAFELVGEQPDASDAVARLDDAIAALNMAQTETAAARQVALQCP